MRIGIWGLLITIRNPQHSIGNYLGPYNPKTLHRPFMRQAEQERMALYVKANGRVDKGCILWNQSE